jgi:hypothetical protein
VAREVNQVRERAKKMILFLSSVEKDYSRSSTLFNALVESGEKVEFIPLPSNFLVLAAKLFQSRRQIQSCEQVIVMSPCHKITPLVRLFSKKVILDAGWPLSDSNFTRGRRRINFFRPLLNLLIDLIAMHSAHLVILESHHQLIRVSNKFRVKLQKLSFRFTGVSEENYLNQPAVLPSEISSLDLTGKRIVCFRGKNNIESGLEILAAASWELPDDIFVIVATDKPVQTELNPRNSIVLNRFLEHSEIAAIYQVSDLAIGQIASVERLNWTIPHKAFEAAFFSTPYLSRKSDGILEFLDIKSAIYIENITESTLANKILDLVRDQSALGAFAMNIHESYIRSASYPVLTEQYKSATR